MEGRDKLGRFVKGMRPKHKLDLDRAKIEYLYVQKKLSIDNIGKKFNCSRIPIVRILNEINIKRKVPWNKGLTKETDERVLKCSSVLKNSYDTNPNLKCGFKKGHLNWNQGLTKETDERLKRISEIKKGKTWEEIHGLEKTRFLKNKLIKRKLGKNLSEETKNKISNALKGRTFLNKIYIRTEEHKRKMGEILKGRIFTEEHKKNISLAKEGKPNPYIAKLNEFQKGKNHPSYGKKSPSTTKRNLENNPAKKPEAKEKIRKALIERYKEGKYNLRPNKPEKVMINLIEKYNLPFNYVGNGQIWFGGFNPDFLSKNPKHIIEVFGDYWHNLPKLKERDKKRLETYSKYGYKTLIIWEHELIRRRGTKLNEQKIINKIREFTK